MKDVSFKRSAGSVRKGLGHVVCAAVLYGNQGLLKCTVPATGESRSLEVYPFPFARFLVKALKSRPETKVEYERLK